MAINVDFFLYLGDIEAKLLQPLDGSRLADCIFITNLGEEKVSNILAKLQWTELRINIELVQYSCIPHKHIPVQ
jgi:hypothetical protein